MEFPIHLRACISSEKHINMFFRSPAAFTKLNFSAMDTEISTTRASSCGGTSPVSCGDKNEASRIYIYTYVYIYMYIYIYVSGLSSQL